MHEDDPADLVHDLFQETLYAGHPLGREIMGDRATIGAMTPAQIRSYHDARYRPASTVVAAAGNVDHDRLVAGLEGRFTGPEGIAPTRDGVGLIPAAPLAVTNRATEQAHLVVGMRALATRDDDRFALSVLNQLLGGGMSSRLFQEIREKRGLVYSVYSYRSAFQDTGLLAVYAGTSPARATTVLDLVNAELDRLVDGDISDRELEVARGHVKGSLVLSLEDPASRMARLGRALLVHGEVLPLREVVERTAAVTSDDLRRVIERVVAGPRTLAAIGPFDEAMFAERVA